MGACCAPTFLANVRTRHVRGARRLRPNPESMNEPATDSLGRYSVDRLLGPVWSDRLVWNRGRESNGFMFSIYLRDCCTCRFSSSRRDRSRL